MRGSECALCVMINQSDSQQTIRVRGYVIAYQMERGCVVYKSVSSVSPIDCLRTLQLKG